ncbi:hypothetical protein C0W42_22055 [Photobacterium kishitanii]|uniref:NucA/NucB deoxyribonuclease domain-containing protein n=1 Tax=Photobacterium kishitanii TaxID=318456 RepID=UPI000D15DC7F|nr:NucA/NucB deoxyribonuclease domain-containing protein [Photobacterium kishitanii]PSU84437.1 hypothetical protein C0W42_22055 [Photobacterium kishitanii]
MSTDCGCPACNPVNQRNFEYIAPRKLTLKERIHKQRIENLAASDRAFEYVKANEARYAEHRASILSEKKMAKTGLLDSINDIASDVVDNVIGAVKQLGNDFISSQQAMLAEHLANKGVIQITDTATGKKLLSEEVAERYNDTKTFEILNSEKDGANAIKLMPAYGPLLLAAETIGTKGKNVVKDPESFVSDVVDFIAKPKIAFSKTHTPNIAENIENALKNGAPKTLNRVTNKSEIRKNRRKALRGMKAPDKGLSLDEYPFASSKQGGEGAFVKPVPVTEQNIQGGMLSSFYKKHKLNDGDNFDVEVVD